MSAKSNASKSTKKPSVKRHAPATNHAKRSAAPAEAGVYVRAELNLTISDGKQDQHRARGPFASLEEARRSAIEQLVAAIEDSEYRLTAVRRANTLAALRSAASDT